MRFINILKGTYIISVLSAIVIIHPSCEKVKELAKFDMNYTLPDEHFSIDSADFLPLKTEFLLLQKSMTLNVDSIKEQNELEEIGETWFDYINLSIENPDWATLGCLNSARITLSAPGIDETRVAYIDSVDMVAKTIDFKLDETDISPFISAGNFVVSMYGDIRPPIPAASVSLVLKSKLKMKVQPF